MSQEQRLEISKEDREAFAGTLRQFADSLPERQRRMLEAIVNTAGMAVAHGDVSAYAFPTETFTAGDDGGSLETPWLRLITSDNIQIGLGSQGSYLINTGGGPVASV